MEPTKMSLKLLIDTKSNRVLFAEAGKDFVDFLFNLLSLPVGAVIRLLSGRSTLGSIENIYSSFGSMNEIYLQPNLCKDILLNPSSSTYVTNFPLLTNGSESTAPEGKIFYTCEYGHGYVASNFGTTCPRCYGRDTMTEEVEYDGISINRADPKKTPNGFVQGIITYMVSDDLSVTPMSMISSISLINEYNISQINVLEERMVEFGPDEALELLMASFQSKATTLTAVFLGKKEVESCDDLDSS